MLTPRTAGAFLALLSLTSACGDEPSEPLPGRTGALALTTSTTGRDPDPDGYVVTLDGTQSVPVPANGVVTIPDVTSGTHTLTLDGLASNCLLTTPAPIEVLVTDDGGGAARLDVACSTVYTLTYNADGAIKRPTPRARRSGHFRPREESGRGRRTAAGCSWPEISTGSGWLTLTMERSQSWQRMTTFPIR